MNHEISFIDIKIYAQFIGNGPIVKFLQFPIAKKVSVRNGSTSETQRGIVRIQNRGENIGNIWHIIDKKIGIIQVQEPILVGHL